jgi:hypothetical protein
LTWIQFHNLANSYISTGLDCWWLVISFHAVMTFKKNAYENFQKILFLMLSSHYFTPKRNELRYHCCLSQLYFIGH